MTDEKFVFVNDVKEKGITARSARKKRTHSGKGGAVRFPSDNLSRKEIKAMNSEVKSYRLNDPMTWDEFKAMPDDLKQTYIKLLRERFGVPDIKIAEMMGIGKDTISRFFRVLGLRQPEHRSGKEKWDSEGWIAFVNGVPVPTADPIEQPANEAQEDIASSEQFPPPEGRSKAIQRAIPCSGSMAFEGKVEEVLMTVGVLLGGANVHISITWNVIDEGKDSNAEG